MRWKRRQTVEAGDKPVLADGNISWRELKTARRTILIRQEGEREAPHEMPQRRE